MSRTSHDPDPYGPAMDPWGVLLATVGARSDRPGRPHCDWPAIHHDGFERRRVVALRPGTQTGPADHRATQASRDCPPRGRRECTPLWTLNSLPAPLRRILAHKCSTCGQPAIQRSQAFRVAAMAAVAPVAQRRRPGHHCVATRTDEARTGTNRAGFLPSSSENRDWSDRSSRSDYLGLDRSFRPAWSASHSGECRPPPDRSGFQALLEVVTQPVDDGVGFGLGDDLLDDRLDTARAPLAALAEIGLGTVAQDV